MTGMIEQLQYRNQQLEAAFKRAQDDNEFRFQQLGAKGGAAPAPTTMPVPNAAAPQGVAPTVRGSPAALPPVTPPTGKRSDVFDPSQQPNAPGAPRSLGGGDPITAAEPEAPVGAPGGRAAGAPLDLSTVNAPAGTDPNSASGAPPRMVGGNQQLATLPPSQSPKDEYDLAYGYVLRKDYALAEQAFRDFLKKHPSDALTPDASYWLGETLFQRQRYQDAADSFLIVVRNHENSGKAPDALLRLGQSLAALGQKDMACASLNEVNRKYPKASAGVKRGVAAEQKKAAC
ncbi:MAG: tol-pal system protein YbgF [Pseudolabrys sp.]|nr:tol-pal system protein YbgF [Pseudolabrys sp.]